MRPRCNRVGESGFARPPLAEVHGDRLRLELEPEELASCLVPEINTPLSLAKRQLPRLEGVDYIFDRDAEKPRRIGRCHFRRHGYCLPTFKRSRDPAAAPGFRHPTSAPDMLSPRAELPSLVRSPEAGD